MVRMDYLKVFIIFVFGRILKMDFIKKIIRKFVGDSVGIVFWVINVGNECG